MATKLTIVQPYVPSYRMPFFTQLSTELSRRDILLNVAAAMPTSTQAQRGDAARLDCVTATKARVLKLGTRNVTYLGSWSSIATADAVIVGLAGSSIDTNLALFTPKRSRRIGVWGHVKSYVAPQHPLDAYLERVQMRRADHVFAYTQGGAEFAEEAVRGKSQVTAVMNSVDTSLLVRQTQLIESGEHLVDKSAMASGTSKKVFSFIGGIDESKRVRFLASTLDRLWKKDSSAHLLIGGSGADESLLAPAVSRGQATMLGRVGPTQIAEMLSISEAILMPGRIGLVAIEALATGTPIITTEWPWHAPEYEYLSRGENVFVTPDNEDAFATFISAFEDSPPALRSLRWEYPTLSNMVANYVAGIEQMLN